MELAIEHDVEILISEQYSRAVAAYQFMARRASIKSKFTKFFDGMPKVPQSVESAVHDAVVYSFSVREDIDMMAEIFTISREGISAILYNHAERTNKSTYYRIYTRTLDSNRRMFFPVQYKERTINTEKSMEYVAEEILRMLSEKTGASRSLIVSDSRKPELVRCRMVFANLMYACFEKPHLDNTGRFIGSDHSGVLFYRRKHEKYQDNRSYDDPIAREYWKLYYHIFAQLEMALKER